MSITILCVKGDILGHVDISSPPSVISTFVEPLRTYVVFSTLQVNKVISTFVEPLRTYVVFSTLQVIGPLLALPTAASLTINTDNSFKLAIAHRKMSTGNTNTPNPPTFPNESHFDGTNFASFRDRVLIAAWTCGARGYLDGSIVNPNTKNGTTAPTEKVKAEQQTAERPKLHPLRMNRQDGPPKTPWQRSGT
ncbi:hypothetical protein H2248_011310 [Termitomyces sp. 'cryptogamus']|nr:hypothetical protein H2248_011310 [Termitomyces sp. 'cryptogamus']